MNIYVGNLSWQMTDEDLRNLFEQHGTVASAKIVKDKISAAAKALVLLKWKTIQKLRQQSQVFMTAKSWVVRLS